MGSIPILKPREVARILESFGFIEVRQRGSHKQYRHTDGRGTTVLFIPVETSHLFCCGKLPKTSG
jgi:predicted RNA binding protein YcfA (HicA-like mRNA interferase family)